MSTQPKALLHAEWLERSLTIGAKEAATELRRLHAANIDCVNHFNAIRAERDQLLSALKVMVRDMNAVNAGGQYGIELEPALYQANNAIAKAEK